MYIDLQVDILQNKIHMEWNGKVFVGNKLGMEFTTPGPEELATLKGRGDA